MRVLAWLRIKTKLALLLAMSTVAMIAIAVIGAVTLHQHMLDDRVDKLRAVVNSAFNIAAGLEARVQARQITHQQAFDLFYQQMHALRFDNGTGYIVVMDLHTGVILVHGAKAAQEGRLAPNDPTTGRSISSIVVEAIQPSNEAVANFMFPKPGETVPLPKFVVINKFLPWNILILTGGYTDDLEAAFRTTMLSMGGVGGGILLLTTLLAWLITRDITGSLFGLRTAMDRLANNDLTASIPGADRGDEVGAMAATVLVFKNNGLAMQRLQLEQEEARRRADTEKRAALCNMADTIESETVAVLEQVRVRTVVMATTADAMSASAKRTGNAAESAANAAGQAMANAQSVAGAAEQLSASIREICSQMDLSAAVVGRAVLAGDKTRAAIEALNQQVEKIGDVAGMIGDIAARTNLLALNATIEAARAGDAGRGFAVVASEVKALAAQTARSTKEIAHLIGEVRQATSASVVAVKQIEQTIGEVNVIAGSIAAAVEQQGAATAEIARNVTETASTANEMTTRTTEVSAEADETGRQAVDVRENASSLGMAVQGLKQAIVHVVRTSTPEVGRRRSLRYVVQYPCRLVIEGQTSHGQLVDLSTESAGVRGAPAARMGATGTLHIDGVAFALPMVVKRSAGGMLGLELALDTQTRALFEEFLNQLRPANAA